MTLTEFPKIIANALDDKKISIDVGNIVIYIDHLRRLTIIPFFKNGCFESIILHTDCIDEKGEQLRDKISILNVQLKCSNNIKLKINVCDRVSIKEISLPNPQNTYLNLHPSTHPKQESPIQAKQLSVQFDNERYLTFESIDGDEIEIKSLCKDANGEKCKNKFAMLSFKPGGCNTVLLDVYTEINGS